MSAWLPPTLAAALDSPTAPTARAEPSPADRVMCEKTGLPWIIVNHPLGTFTVNQPVPFLAPFPGRTFVHGVHDCYGIVRDWYAAELGITRQSLYRRMSKHGL